jgi:putative IMPACT (imprinted ancient) family translation regulator
MYRIEQGSEVHYTVNHSRFIGFALACADERDLRARLSEIAGRHADAHHLAFAYRLKTESGLAAYCNDAGEPGGTAGRPILAQIEGFEVVNAVVAGGLVRAYGGTAKMALDAATLAPYVEFTELRLSIDYPRLRMLTYALEKAGGEIVSKSFGEHVDLVIRLPVTEAPAFLGRFAEKP